jgi:hypothetical protein
VKPSEAGKGEVAAVVVGAPSRRTGCGGGEAFGAGGPPHPGREPGDEGFLLAAAGGLGVVADAASIAGGVGDGVEPLVERGVEQRGSHRREVPHSEVRATRGRLRRGVERTSGRAVEVFDIDLPPALRQRDSTAGDPR